MNINDLKLKNSRDLYNIFSGRTSRYVEFSSLKGELVEHIFQVEDQYIIIITNSGYMYALYHEQDCCENVYIDDVCGDLELCTGLIVRAEETSSEGDIPKGLENDMHSTWTFYKLDTINDNVTIKFFGESNGYYSETAYLKRILLKDI